MKVLVEFKINNLQDLDVLEFEIDFREWLNNIEGVSVGGSLGEVLAANILQIKP